MSGIVIVDDEDRAFLHRMVDEAQVGTLVEMSYEPASDPQRKRMWALLGEVARQYQHEGRFYDKSQWKILMLHACGQEVDFMPSLDGSTFIPYEGRSSKMDKAGMGELLAFIESWGAQNGVTFKEVA